MFVAAEDWVKFCQADVDVRDKNDDGDPCRTGTPNSMNRTSIPDFGSRGLSLSVIAGIFASRWYRRLGYLEATDATTRLANSAALRSSSDRQTFPRAYPSDVDRGAVGSTWGGAACGREDVVVDGECRLWEDMVGYGA